VELLQVFELILRQRLVEGAQESGRIFLNLCDYFVHVTLNCKQICLYSLQLHLLHVVLLLLLVLGSLCLFPVHQKFEVHLHLSQNNLHDLIT